MKRGLYEVLITEQLRRLLAELDAVQAISPLRNAEAADRIALHVQRVIKRVLDDMPDKQRVRSGIALAREIVELLDDKENLLHAHYDARPVAEGEVLEAILNRLPDGSTERITEPLTPLLDTTLLTNAPGEPRVGHQIVTEIDSADRIDVVMAFILRSGLRPMQDALRRHCQSGRAFRVLTTTYTGSTELAALEMLTELGAQVRVSYDTSMTRLHAKAWLFHRDSGFSTAFVGSSNLSHSAQHAGLEWNVRVSSARNPDVVEKISGVFENYWFDGDFVPFDADEFAEAAKTIDRGPKVLLGPVEIKLYPFQDRLLEQIAASLNRGRTRNLLVSATGTGKTVMAAIHFSRRRKKLARDRLLFIAHRKEILEQSLATFRYALRAPDFGELWVDGRRPQDFEHVFASVQSLNAVDRSNLKADHFDIVIVDEFHHAAAKTYDRLLRYLSPRELLGLTATPERSDGLDILQYFDGHRIAAELRLWDAIDQHRLVPFSYFGLSDGLDLRQVPWRRGRGYDTQSLSNVMTGNEVWARTVIQLVIDFVGDLSSMRALGFCVTVEHARFMARTFDEAGIKSTAIWGDSSAVDRKSALEALAMGEINVLFSVDLFNEGVDLPTVDTLLMLRPTESPTLFLQQLGRGLRKAEGKTFCTVLDFVGTHRREFRFDRRYRGLFVGTRSDLRRHVEQGFPFLPAGCHMQLDRVSKEQVLASIKNAIPSRWPEKVAELRELARSIPNPTLSDYLEETGLELDDIYSGHKSWSDLLEDAGLALVAAGPHESVFRRAIGRLLHVDDADRIEAYLQLVSGSAAPDLRSSSERDKRLARMLVGQLGDQVFRSGTSIDEGWKQLWAHAQVRSELAELMQILSQQNDHVQIELDDQRDVPLVVHGRYTRIEILAAFGHGEGAKIAAWQTGVMYMKQQKADLFAFTLDKTSGAFSPTTRYRDYAISRDLIHWESQSATRAESPTGRRYRNHKRLSSQVYLFARLRADDRAFWFLGPATFESSRGERPMAIVWRLSHPLPGDLYAQFAAAVA